jgi:hypothetical protein
VPIAEFPYVVAISLAELGRDRANEALPVLRELESKILRDSATSSSLPERSSKAIPPKASPPSAA